MTEEREKELRTLTRIFERCDYVHDSREFGGSRFSFHDSLIEALDAVVLWRKRALVLAEATHELIRIYRAGEAVMSPNVLREVEKINRVHEELKRGGT